jgi:hypothetical protein
MRPLRRRSCSTKNLTIYERPLGALVQHVVAGDGACCVSVFLPSLSSLHVENVVDGGTSLSISARTRTTQRSVHSAPPSVSGSTPVTSVACAMVCWVAGRW